MGLRTTPRDVVLVQNFLETIGTSGQTKRTEPDGDPIPVRCNAYPLTSTELANLGIVNDVNVRLFVRGHWPGDQYSVITFDGALWEQNGPIQTFRAGTNSGHTQVILRKRGTAHGG